MNYEQKKDIAEKINAISGQDLSIHDALDQWEIEHGAMLQLFDENQAYQILTRRLMMALAMADKFIEQVEAETGLFMPERTRKTIQKYREFKEQIENTKIGAADLSAESMKGKPHANKIET